MELGNELFIYLGYSDNVHFFSHLIYSDVYNYSNISVNIYDCMIYNKMIKKNDNIIIFHMNQEENLCFIIQVVHTDFKIINFNFGEFKTILNHLFSLDRDNNTMVIAFNGKTYSTFLYDFKNMIFGDNLNVDNENYYKSIEIITTSQPINYILN